MARMKPERKLEMGRRVASRELTTEQAAKEYGCHKSTVWDAKRKYLEVPRPAEPATSTVKDVLRAPNKGDPRGYPDVDHALLASLEAENARLHDEVRVLQKIVMVLGGQL